MSPYREPSGAWRSVRVNLDGQDPTAVVTCEGPSNRGYDVVVGAGALLSLTHRLGGLTPTARRALLITDGNLPEETLGKTVGAIAAAGIQPIVETLRLDERSKSLQTVEGLLERALDERLERSEPVIALGGGVLGDIAGFVAAIYRRGVSVIQCPTTLLAMVDASVGGKTGVNLFAGASRSKAGEQGLRKNMAGCFWQPKLVVCDVDILASLPAREFRAGLAECLKHALIGGPLGEPALLEWMLQNAAAFDPSTRMDATVRATLLSELVARNVALKARVVEGDERELRPSGADGRAALNAGHTIGHALEAVYRPTLLHGEAVALGLIAETAIAEHLGRLAKGQTETVRRHVRALGLPTRLTDPADSAAILDATQDDKKTSGGKVRLVVPGQDRRAMVIDDPPAEALRAGLGAIAPGV